MFARIGPEFKSLQGEDQNFNAWEDKTRIPMSGKIRKEFQFLKG